MESPRFWSSDVFLILLAAVLAAATGALYVGVNLYFTNEALTFPLDDAYIFLHYARNFASGHPFVYNVGDLPTTGGTSYLYTLLLTPLALIFRSPDGLVWAAYLLNVVLYGVSLWLFARLARYLFDGQYVLVSTLVFATTGPITFHALGGMDTGLFMLALLFGLYSYIVYRQYDRLLQFILALAALTLARPEGILAAVLLAALALIGRAPGIRNDHPPLRPRWWVLLGLIPIPFYFLANYLLGGHLTSASYLSKSILTPTTQPWALRLATILTFTIYVVKSVLAGLDGLYVRAFYNANTPYAGANFFAPLALAFFLVGWGRAARKSWSARVPSAAFVGGILFLAGAAAACVVLPYPRHFARYVAPYFPLFVVGVLVGVDGLASLIRYGRPQISHAAMFWTGAAYFLVFGLISTGYFALAHGMSARDIRYQHLAVAGYLRENVPPAAGVFTHDVGALAYYGERRVVDLEGLVTREGWRYGNEGIGSAAEFIRREGKPGDYFVGYLDVYPFDEAGAVASPDYYAALFTTTMAGGRRMSVARFVPQMFAPVPPPSPRRWPGYELVEEVDVADVASERAHGYRYRRRAANTLTTYAALLPAEGGREEFEAGRLVCGKEEFAVALPPGRPVVAAVRCEPPYRSVVHVDGVPAGRWEVGPAAEGHYVDAYFPLPARFFRRTPVRLTLETLGDDLSSNKPARYFFYAQTE